MHFLGVLKVQDWLSGGQILLLWTLLHNAVNHYTQLPIEVGILKNTSAVSDSFSLHSKVLAIQCQLKLSDWSKSVKLQEPSLLRPTMAAKLHHGDN